MKTFPSLKKGEARSLSYSAMSFNIKLLLTPEILTQYFAALTL